MKSNYNGLHQDDTDLIKYNLDQSLNLIHGILDYTHINTGHLSLNLGKFSIKNTINKLFKTMKIFADKKGIQLKLNFSV